MKVLRHIAIVLLALFLLVGVPVYRSGYIQNKLAGVDTVSSASAIITQPSGEYAVLINPDLHTNKENLAVWESFFSGEEIDYLFEDISCIVIDTDAEGLELAKSLQSRLPENQMEVRTEDASLLLAKVFNGIYDVALISREVYETPSIQKLISNISCDLIESEGV